MHRLCVVTISTNLYRTVERAVGGDLSAFLRDRRARGDSWETIAKELWADHGVEVTGAGLRKWGQKLDGEEATA